MTQEEMAKRIQELQDAVDSDVPTATRTLMEEAEKFRNAAFNDYYPGHCPYCSPRCPHCGRPYYDMYRHYPYNPNPWSPWITWSGATTATGEKMK